MLKKIIIAFFLIGFTGVLIWGGVNRTLAKSGHSEGRGAKSVTNSNGNWIEEHDHEDCDQDGYQGGVVADQVNLETFEKGNGNNPGASTTGRGGGNSG